MTQLQGAWTSLDRLNRLQVRSYQVVVASGYIIAGHFLYDNEGQYNGLGGL